MKVFFKIMIALCMISIQSCGKTEQFQSTKVSGQVINGITNDVFTRGTIELIEIETSPKPFGPVTELTIDEQAVQSDGSYFFEFKAKRGSRFSYRLEYEFPPNELFVNGGEDGNAGVEQIELQKKESINENFIIFPACELKFLVYYVNEFDDNDAILIYQITEARGKSPSGGYVGGGGYDNESRNEIADFSTVMSGHMTIEWHVTRNGQIQVYLEEIFVAHNEKRVYEIYY